MSHPTILKLKVSKTGHAIITFRNFLERMKGKALEWKAIQTCKIIVMELMEVAVMESEWRQESCRNIVLEVVEDAVIASRQRICRQVMEESVLEVCWETFDLSRIVKEVGDGGMERMGRVETQLRGLREDEEALVQIISEEAARNRRMEKTEESLETEHGAQEVPEDDHDDGDIVNAGDGNGDGLD